MRRRTAALACILAVVAYWILVAHARNAAPGMRASDFIELWIIGPVIGFEVCCAAYLTRRFWIGRRERQDGATIEAQRASLREYSRQLHRDDDKKLQTKGR